MFTSFAYIFLCLKAKTLWLFYCSLKRLFRVIVDTVDTGTGRALLVGRLWAKGASGMKPTQALLARCWMCYTNLHPPSQRVVYFFAPRCHHSREICDKVNTAKMLTVECREYTWGIHCKKQANKYFNSVRSANFHNKLGFRMPSLVRLCGVKRNAVLD